MKDDHSGRGQGRSCITARYRRARNSRTCRIHQAIGLFCTVDMQENVRVCCADEKIKQKLRVINRRRVGLFRFVSAIKLEI